MKRFSKVMAIVLALAMVLPGVANAANDVSEDSFVEAEVESEQIELIDESEETEETEEVQVTEVQSIEVNAIDAEEETPLKDGMVEMTSLGVNSDSSKYIQRVSGDDRVKTSIEISKNAYKAGGAQTVVLAGYYGSADALAGTLFAASKNAPLLLTPKGEKLSEELKAEIKRLGAKDIYILGEQVAVDEGIEDELKALKLNVKRIDGDNRYETAIEIAKEITNNKKIFLTLGKTDKPTETLADALAIGPASANKNMPILLTETDKLPKETEDAIKAMGITDITIIGGKAAVSEGIKAKLENMGISVNRISGDNRYETAIEIAERYFAKPKNLIVANGKKGSDALVGGYFAVINDAPIILTNEEGVDKNTLNYIEGINVKPYVLGGESVISLLMFNLIRDKVDPNFTPDTQEPVAPEPKPEPKPEPEPEPEPEPKPEPSGKPMICLDYGHGGADPGAGYNGRKEKDDTLEVGMKVAAVLRRHGVVVDETRTSDKTMSLRERSDFANKKNYDYFVSFHRNAFMPETAHGVETFTYITGSPKAVSLANAIQKNLVEVGFNDRKVKRDNFHVLRETRAPAVLIELGFIDSTIDNKIHDEKKDEIVIAVSKAILGELGIKYKK